MTLMLTYGTLEHIGKDHQWLYTVGERRQKTFAYPEAVTNHFTFCNSVDANNRDRMYP